MSGAPLGRASTLRQIPRTVWALGLVSMLMDISSEMVHSILPVFLVTSLGASMITVGLIEGVAEATASVAKVFSGVLSDWIRRRKVLVAFGYGLSAFTNDANQRGDYRLEPGQSITFRYRICLHPGDAEGGQIAARFHDYAEPPATRWE